MESWERVTLSDVCDLIPGFAFKSKDFGDYSSKVIKITHIMPPSVDMDNLSGVDISKYNSAKLKKFIAQVGDYVLAMTGATIGKIGRIEHGSAYINQRVLLFKPRQNVDREFLYYALQQYEFAQYIISHVDSESAQPNISAGTIGKYQIELPPMDIQKKIGALLRIYDEKCENNRRINDNLQAQASAIFKAWFVDYVPFGGRVPSEWREYRLADFLPVVTGKKNANVSSNSGQYPFFSCSQDIAWTDNYSFEGNAILVAGNGDFNVKWYNGKFEAYQRTYVLIPYDSKYTSWLYYAVKYNLAEITSAARGSVIRFITKGNLENFTFLAPIELDKCEIINTFSAINRAIDQRIRENYCLQSLRDSLLPKLMSGEIDVSDVQL